jgi:vancomycin resistance protein YoaR
VRHLAIVGVALLIAATSLALAVLLYHQIYADRIVPGVKVVTPLLTADLGGQAPEVARRTLAAPHERYLASTLRIGYRGKEWQRTPRELGLRIDTQPTIEAALAVGRASNLPERLQQQLLGLRVGVAVPAPKVALDEARVRQFVAGLASEIDTPPTHAALALQADGRVVVLPSQPGRKLDAAASASALGASLLRLSSEPQSLVVDEVTAPLAEGDLEGLRRLAEKAIGSPLTVETTIDAQPRQWRLAKTDLASMIFLRTSDTHPPRYELGVDEAKIRAHVERIAAEVERPARGARFARDEGAIRVLQPGEDGRRVEVTAAIARIREGLASEERRVELPWQPIRPAYPEGEVGPQTFPELIERATTVYEGVLAERVFNVELAASRLNGVVVAPGATFSFNEAVGEVSYRAGYKRGYGISRDGDDVVTIPSEGGGICQVATTLFQSVVWAGYPVIERNWHLYWIPRYGQRPKGLKGLDATIDQVYDRDGKLVQAIDLRWRNNTEAPVLVTTETDGARITVSLWGQRPAWQVKVSEPKIERVVKADTRPVRQPDSTLRPGQTVMIEHAEDGFQSTIVRTILRDGKIVDETRFVSTYRPSRNVYAYGGPAAATAATPEPSDDRPATPEPPPNGATFITPVPSPEIATPTRVPPPTPRPTARPTATPRPATTTPTPRPSSTAPSATTPRTASPAASPSRTPSS